MLRGRLHFGGLMVLSLSKMGVSEGRWSFLAGLCGVYKAEGGLREERSVAF